MIIIACPGQGSQTPGFLNEWLEVAGARQTLEEFSDACEIDLVKHGTISDAETIKDTKVAQPLIVAASLLAWQELQKVAPTKNIGIAGHSVGEFAAASIAGILKPRDALKLVGVRGRAMADAAAEVETTMAAVLGGNEEEVLALLKSLDLTPANMNGAGQIVAAGTVSAVEKLQEEAPRGVRVIRLQVAGAFHTHFMGSAVAHLDAQATLTQVADPLFKIWTNSDGKPVESGQKYLELLVQQIKQPVRWDLCMNSFVESGVTGLIELAPGGTLAGIAKRAMRGTTQVAIKTPADLDAAVALLKETEI